MKDKPNVQSSADKISPFLADAHWKPEKKTDADGVSVR
jgi:hypothetical protein